MLVTLQPVALTNVSVKVRHKHNIEGPWTVIITVTDDEAGVDQVTFEIRRGPDGPELLGGSLLRTEPIRPSDLQRYGWSRWATVAIAAVRSEAFETWSQFDPEHPVSRAAQRAMGVEPTRLKPGPKPKRGPEFFEDIARRYADLLAGGERAPSLTLAKELDYGHSTMRGFVGKARQLGYLPAGQRGRAG